MGEAKQQELVSRQQLIEALRLETASGGLKVHWDGNAQATALGQMAFFIEFLTVTGLFEQWVADCPLDYKSPNGSSRRDILGTWLLSIVSGHWRYAHVSTIRADGVNPRLLGMSGVVAEDTVRRALKAIDETLGSEWLSRHLGRTVLGLLDAPWILDVDVTIKPLYAKQQGAVLGYNPHKPGRPSHAYHSYQVSGLRLILGVDVLAGNESHAHYTLPGLLKLLDSLPTQKRPKLVRGDAGLGVEPMLCALEERQQSYLFKLRLTKNVKRYIEKLFWEQDWSNLKEGWEGRNGELKLNGWSRARRVIILRRALRGEALLADESQGILAFIETDMAAKRYEYAVLVTDLKHELLTIAQLYRDRADAENAFDELKNQWGWGGFTTQDLARCRLAAWMGALGYTLWNIFVRLAEPDKLREAITSRPLLLAGIAERTRHGRQTSLKIASTHGRAKWAQRVLTDVARFLRGLINTAEQLTADDRWARILAHAVRSWLKGRRLRDPPRLVTPA